MSAIPAGVKSTSINFGGVVRPAYFRENTSDWQVFEEIFKLAVYDVSKLARWPELRAYLRSEEDAGREALVVDAGANIGASAMFLAHMAPNVKIVAIEPEAGNFEMLKLNTQGLNCECVQAALASEEGFVNVVDLGRGNWAFRTEPDSSGIPAVTMNGLYETYSSNKVRPFAAKIDIEGAEKDVFSKNLEWLGKTPLVMVEIHDWMYPRSGIGATVLSALLQHPFDFVISNETLLAIRWDP